MATPAVKRILALKAQLPTCAERCYSGLQSDINRPQVAEVNVTVSQISIDIAGFYPCDQVPSHAQIGNQVGALPALNLNPQTSIKGESSNDQT